MNEDPLLPAVGEWVGFVLQGGPTEGEVRKACVTGRFVDDLSNLPRIAKRYGRSEDDMLKEFGRYVNLTVLLEDGDLPGIVNGNVFEIRSVRHEEKQTLGTWHFLDVQVVVIAQEPDETPNP